VRLHQLPAASDHLRRCSGYKQAKGPRDAQPPPGDLRDVVRERSNPRLAAQSFPREKAFALWRAHLPGVGSAAKGLSRPASGLVLRTPRCRKGPTPHARSARSVGLMASSTALQHCFWEDRHWHLREPNPTWRSWPAFTSAQSPPTAGPPTDATLARSNSVYAARLRKAPGRPIVRRYEFAVYDPWAIDDTISTDYVSRLFVAAACFGW
jgi:hypothetical protein